MMLEECMEYRFIPPDIVKGDLEHIAMEAQMIDGSSQLKGNPAVYEKPKARGIALLTSVRKMPAIRLQLSIIRL